MGLKYKCVRLQPNISYGGWKMPCIKLAKILISREFKIPYHKASSEFSFSEKSTGAYPQTIQWHCLLYARISQYYHSNLNSWLIPAKNSLHTDIKEKTKLD